MAPEILRSVRYRIQNVDFGTFLERRDKGALVMRPKKDSIKQQWVFHKVRQDTYEIQNAYERTSVVNGKLQVPTGGGGTPTGSVSCVKSSAAPAKRWRVTVDSQTSNIYFVNEKLGDNDILLSVEGNDVPTIAQDATIQDIKNIHKGEEYQWRLLEETPASLPDGDGKYRIRTLNGMAVHTEGSKKLSIKNQRRGDHRAWEIQSKGNGKCTILNIQDNAYLATEKDRDGEWAINLSKTDKQLWDIHSTSDFTYSICVERPISVNRTLVNASLSLTLKSDTVILKPMKTAHNQIWLIELTDAALDIPTADPDEPTEVLPNLKSGEYFLCNLGPNEYYVSMNVNPVFELVAGDKDDRNEFKLESKAEGQPGEVVLYYSGNGLTKYLAIKNNRLVGEDSEFRWIIEQTPTSGRFYICNGNQPQEVLSAPYIGENKFSIQSKASTQGLNSLWNFVPA